MSKTQAPSDPANAVLVAAKIALAEAELLLHKVWADHGLRSIDDGEGVIRDVAKAADRMDAAHSQVVAALTATPVDARVAFEAWAPTQHMRTERWTVHTELYDDENAISAWQGWAAGVAWVTGQAVDKTPEMQSRAVDKAANLQSQITATPWRSIREVIRISDRSHPAWGEVKDWLESNGEAA